MGFYFGKKDKLKSRKLIETLFNEGQSVSAYPLRLVYLETSFEDGSFTKTAVSVSKRHFKKAADRNRIKRLIREVFRVKKSHYFNNISTQYALMILYIGNEKPDFQSINATMDRLFEKFSNRTFPNEH